MSTKQYFKQSDYATLWSKAVRTRDSLAEVAKKYLAIINALPGNCLLDIGVGDGRFIMPCVETGLKTYVGLDVSKETLLNAKNNRLSKEYESVIFLVQGDAEHLPFREEMFDRVICVATSWYLPNLQSFISEISRVSKSQSTFFGDFMNFSNGSIHSQRTLRIIMNSFLRNIRRFQGIRPLVLYTGELLDRLYEERRYGYDKGWLISYFTWGVTPFHPASFSDIISLFPLYGMKIKKLVGDKNAPLVYIEASKL